MTWAQRLIIFGLGILFGSLLLGEQWLAWASLCVAVLGLAVAPFDVKEVK